MRRARVLRVITRLNIGGPSIQAIDLSRDGYYYAYYRHYETYTNGGGQQP